MLEMFWRIYDLMGPLAPTDLSLMAHSPLAAFEGMLDFTSGGVILDPQLYWLRVHRRIISFLQKTPDYRQLRLRGEDVLKDPERQLEKIASWLGVRIDSGAIDCNDAPRALLFFKLWPSKCLVWWRSQVFDHSKITA